MLYLMIYMILITGATGFIGKHLIELLYDDYDDCNEKIDIITLGRSKGNDIVADLTDSEQLKVLKDYDIDIVIHLASLIPGKEDKERKKKDRKENNYFDTNIIGTYNLLKILIEKEKEKEEKEIRKLKKIILLSSVSVYDHMNNDYGMSKYTQELLVKTFCDRLGIEYLILRPSSVYGKGMHNTVLKVFHDKSLRNEDIAITVKDYRQNFIYVEDVVKIINIGLEKEFKGIYDLFSNDTISLEDLADLIVIINDSKSKIIKNYETINIDFRIYDNNKLIKDFGLGGSDILISLCEGIKKMV